MVMEKPSLKISQVSESCHHLWLIDLAVLGSLSLDVSRQLLYFTDFYNGIVAEIATDGTGYREFINDFTQSPVAVVINPTNRFA
jgi:hypothetical protein